MDKLREELSCAYNSMWTRVQSYNHFLGTSSCSILAKLKFEKSGFWNIDKKRKHLAVQDEDATLALKLHREEFMEAFRPSDEQPTALQQ
ncbi:hypothetical protein AgCh_009905 [Apium graveolens]